MNVRTQKMSDDEKVSAKKKSRAHVWDDGEGQIDKVEESKAG